MIELSFYWSLMFSQFVDTVRKSAKMARYCHKNVLCNVLFVIFTAIWFVTRCGIYPFKIIYSTTIEAPSLIQFFPVYYIFNCLLLILLVLQLFWSFLILRIALNAVRSGEMEDVRSDDESDDEECKNDATKGLKINGLNKMENIDSDYRSQNEQCANIDVITPNFVKMNGRIPRGSEKAKIT
ncbi:unnamed protein product [Soboliphyme baturini]|uniref:TLC domain-containing protein n=1 Tax=Soboliphyme baturini TaxID=241478 RepID=A0A183J2G7_9BILA|nr:unnamed protein product [Soboliphyme baturini]